MSYLYIKLKKMSESEGQVAFELYLPEFGGTITIDKIHRSCQHFENDYWRNEKFYPISLFSMTLEERKKMAANEYKSFAGGAWSEKLHNFIQTCLLNNEYPEKKEIIA